MIALLAKIELMNNVKKLIDKKILPSEIKKILKLKYLKNKDIMNYFDLSPHYLYKFKIDSRHPYYNKMKFFRNRKYVDKNKNNKNNFDINKIFHYRLCTFHEIYKEKGKYDKRKFNKKDIIKKFGENPKCYLSGLFLDWDKPYTWCFDHIYPKSKGGLNTLNNLGICHPSFNQLKTFMTYEELIIHCKKVINNFKINKIPKGSFKTKFFDIKQLVTKIGLHPICYLTGDTIDINDTKNYSFDHIIPKCYGGGNSLLNLQICTKVSNQSKNKFLLKNYIKMCNSIIENTNVRGSDIKL